jgi:pyridoxal phosphate enzyme (YggS family)
MSTIQTRVTHILHDIPPHVTVLAAAKGVPDAVLREALEAGIRLVGENRISEARRARAAVHTAAEWHLIGRLRLHDVRSSTLRLFDVIQTIDTLELARRVDAACGRMQRRLSVYVEVNSGREPQKGGVLPEQALEFVRSIASLPHLKIEGLMTMGPLASTREGYRPCFSETRALFTEIRQAGIPGVELTHLSMGTSDSYLVAIEEGATMVRLGTTLFGAR